MTIGVKYWNEGASVPGSFTNLEVITCFLREEWRIFDQDESLDGTITAPKRKYLRATIEPRKPYDSTVYTVLTAMASADYVRIDDSRHSGTNTVDFVSANAIQPTREGQSEVLKRMVFEYVSKSAQ